MVRVPGTADFRAILAARRGLMATFPEKIKRALADLEQVRRSLNAVDEDHAEAAAVGAVLDGPRAELAREEQRLARTNETIAAAEAEHRNWWEVSAREQSATNARIDQLQGKLRALEQQVKEAEERHGNILAGIAALHARLKV